jgi:hypothetical protein
MVLSGGAEFLFSINPLNTELNPICHLLVELLGAHHVFHVSRIRVKVPPFSDFFFLIVHKTISYTIHTNICGTDMLFLGESMLQHGKIRSALAHPI